MIYALYFIVIFGAIVIGSITGLGGGVIIKPLLDLINYHDLGTISFLSSTGVFFMALLNTVKAVRQKTPIDFKLVMMVALGAMAGGLFGAQLFSIGRSIWGDSTIKLLQNALLLVSLIVVLYIMNRVKQTYQLQSWFFKLLIGLALGLVSSFIGIGGGPINVVVFFLFFSIDMKNAAVYSLATIVFSQLTNLPSLIMKMDFGSFDFIFLGIIVVGSYIGSQLGSKLRTAFTQKQVQTWFNASMVLLMGIAILNLIRLV